MFRRTDDPLRDYERWDAEREAELEMLPICAECGERVTDDHFYEINGEVICPDCLRAYYRKEIEDYID